MPPSDLHVVTGAFGYSGRYIAGRLLQKGYRVRTLTNHPNTRDALFFQVQAVALGFNNPKMLVENIEGAKVLYNTYWVRFGRGSVTHETAVKNSKILFRAAAEAGVERIVHVSITNPSEDSPLPYFRGKAAVERALIESGLSYAILRPTVFFGGNDILVNNIAWFLRNFPVFPVFGAGDYRVQPVSVDDFARLAVEMGEKRENVIMDAVGPDILAYDELVRLVALYTRRRTRILHVSPLLGLAAARAIGWLMLGDVPVTRDEIRGLMANLLVSKNAPTCPTRLSEWIQENAERLGLEYRSELAKHYK